MNPWLQTKKYRCPRCAARYPHDRAHAHACYECPLRSVTKKPITALAPKVYRPAIGGEGR